MPAAPKNTNPIIRINLLKTQGSKSEMWKRALAWLLFSGRYIVIVVEMVVLVAFFYRFKLDDDLATLDEKIKAQIPYVQSLHADEILVDQTQFQISSIKQVKKDTPNWIGVLTTLSQLIPTQTKLVSVSVDRTQQFPKTVLSFNGTTPSSIELIVFLGSLKKEPSLEGVTLTGLGFNKNALDFTITATLVQEGDKKT
jgi:Tfp pilus assembly protein PilN